MPSPLLGAGPMGGAAGCWVSCEFDLGFHPLWISELIQLHEADAVLLVDPSAGFLDPVLAESMIEYSESKP